MSEAKHITRPTPYASSDDFCRIFHQEMNGFYLLSFLLTGDREKAEQCFVSGLDDSVKGNPVFKEWARSWARRAVIQNAVQIINPRPRPINGNGNGHSNAGLINGKGKTLPVEQEEIAVVLELEPFERFVYVISVLERYSDQDCSVLLGCPRRDVLAARTCALQQIGSAAELHRKQQPTASTEKPASQDRRRSSVLKLLVAPHLATSV
jgi:hypothetical protein